MKNVYTLFCLLISTLAVSGQDNLPEIHSLSVPFNLKKQIVANNKTVSCVDTIRYPASKLRGVTVEVDSMSMGYFEAVSQAYHFTGNGTLHGLSAYILLDVDGVPDPMDSISMVISVYDLVNYTPVTDYPNRIGSLIRRDTVDVFDVGFQEQPLMFANPVLISDSFVLVIELNSMILPPTVLRFAFTDYGDGNREKLSWANYAGKWYNCYTDWLTAPTGWDSDMMLSPIFEQTYTSAYTADTDTICLGDSVVFTNTTAFNSIDSMFYTAVDSFYLDLGDMSSVNPFAGSYKHDYVSDGVFNTQLVATQFGYDNNCIESSTKLVTVNDTSISKFGFTDVGGGTFQFSDSSSSATNWVWDFGDSSPVDIAQNPSHIFALEGTYYVCLTASDSNGCNTNVFCDSVDFHCDTLLSKFAFVDMGGGAFQFSDSSATASNWSWNFGDTSPVDTTKNPLYTYASEGAYNVCLTISDVNGCDTSVFCDSVEFMVPVGIDDSEASNYVKIYPIPVHTYFNVTIPSNYYEGEILLIDVVGQQLKSIAIENQEKVKVSTEGIASGVYFVSIAYKGQRVFTKRIVIDH